LGRGKRYNDCKFRRDEKISHQPLIPPFPPLLKGGGRD
jgi:hypothetical protein